MKLQAKVILLTMAVLTVIGIIAGGTMLYFQRENSIHQFEQLAAALASTVKSSLEHAMLTGEREPVQEAILRIGQAEMVSGVTVLSAAGNITASSHLAEIGQAPNQPEIRQTLDLGQVSTWTNTQIGRGEFSVVSPVLNKPECQPCHKPGDAVLGAIQVSLGTASLDNQTRQQTIFYGISGIAVLLFMGIGLTYALRRTVLKPISSLAESAQKLSQGNYAARTKGYSNDEIGMLARTFNRMADSVEQRSHELEASRQELADWNANLEKKIEQRTTQLAALNGVITTVSQSLDLELIADAALAKILSVMEIDAGAIHRLDKTARLDLMVYRGLTPGSIERLTRMPSGDDAWSKVVQSGQPVLVGGEDSVLKITGMGGEDGEFHAAVILPVRSESRVLGTLSLASYRPVKFQPDLTRLLHAMGDAIGIGMANAIAAQNLREASKLREQLLGKLISAQEEERKRIARQLHDEASQSLAALVLNLENIADDLPAKYHAEKEKLEVIKDRAVQTLGSIRNLALELRPSVLDHLGLSKAIEWYAKDYLGKRGLEAKVETAGLKIKLPSHTETMLFRIIQEALNNVVTHAHASKVSVSLKLSDARVSVQIEDNGRGFDADAALRGAAVQKNLGLHGMIERATLLGGTLNIRSSPGKGTSLSIEVPFERS